MAAINPHLVFDTGTPPIPEAQAWTRRYDGARGPLIDLSQAVPGYPPHPDMLARLGAAAGSVEAARYGAIAGDDGLRERYAAHLSTLYGAGLDADDVAITAGCNQAFYVTAIALAKAGDAILVPSPWYFNHQMTLAMLGIEPRALRCRSERGFLPDVADAEALIDAKVRAIVLVTPNNPTGAVYPPALIEAFADLCQRHNIWLVIDETYRDFLDAGSGRPHQLFQRPAWRDHVIQLYSFSKSYCIPGHRQGSIVTGPAAQAEIAKVLDCMQICASRTGQAGLAWAIDALVGWREANRAEIGRRAAAFKAVFSGSNGWRLETIGAYFAYLRHPFEGVAAAAVAERLAVTRGVLCLPGTYFGPGQDGHLRVAFANAGVEAIGQLAARFDGFSLD